jgi:hypothetical protein
MRRSTKPPPIWAEVVRSMKSRGEPRARSGSASFTADETSTVCIMRSALPAQPGTPLSFIPPSSPRPWSNRPPALAGFMRSRSTAGVSKCLSKTERPRTTGRLASSTSPKPPALAPANLADVDPADTRSKGNSEVPRTLRSRLHSGVEPSFRRWTT